MDKTQQFKAAVMTLKVQGSTDHDKHRILRKSGSGSDEFSKKAKEVCNKITTLRNVLTENRAAYMRFGSHLKNSAQMTDEQRDLIERESEKFFIFYTQHLAQMRADWKREKMSRQRHEHIDCVIELLIHYLKAVQQIYLDQKKYRVQYELEAYRLLKLAADKKKIPARPGSLKRPNDKEDRESDVRDLDENPSKNRRDATSNSENDWSDDWQWDEEQQVESNDVDDVEVAGTKESVSMTNVSGSTNNESKSTSQLSQRVAVDEDIQKSQQLLDDEVTNSLSPEDIQMFEQENAQLYLEMQGLAEEVEQIEKNVVDIAQLQDIFTEKVSTQHHNIERIANAVIGATENVKDANEQIKQAIQRNAGLRVWSLFFLLVMSFSLLFLDWYYD